MAQQTIQDDLNVNAHHIDAPQGSDLAVPLQPVTSSTPEGKGQKFDILSARKEGAQKRKLDSSNGGAASGSPSPAIRAASASPSPNSRRKAEAKMTFYQVMNGANTIMIFLVGITLGISEALKGLCTVNLNGVKRMLPVLLSGYRSLEVLQCQMKRLNEFFQATYPGSPPAESIIPIFRQLIQTNNGGAFEITSALSDSIPAIKPPS